MPKCRFCDRDNPPGIERCQNCGAWIEQKIAAASSVPNSAESAFQPKGFEGQIIFLVQQGQKIAAIKLYREQTGAGLAEAKTAVEALAEGTRSERTMPPFDGIGADSLEGQVLAILQVKQKIQAIKLYRERTGVGLKQAKDAVEALAAKHGIAQPAGCAGMILLMVVVAIGGLRCWGG